ncbi:MULTISPECIES: hypothetical protein [Pseudomonadota]|uniref:hypothetical protein n=1 Tax=Pseudomonadota TaxID=1224 RepID=UPI00351196C3
MNPDRLDRWLGFVAVAHVFAGLALPFVLLRTNGLDAWLPLDGGDTRVAFALFGPTVASWGLLMWFLVQYGLRRQQAWAANALIAGILVWAPLDAAICHAWGWTPAVILDAVAAIAILVPALWRRAQIGRDAA